MTTIDLIFQVYFLVYVNFCILTLISYKIVFYEKNTNNDTIRDK